MKANETQGGDGNGKTNHADGLYQNVFDARKRRLRGLWERTGRSTAN